MHFVAALATPLWWLLSPAVWFPFDPLRRGLTGARPLMGADKVGSRMVTSALDVVRFLWSTITALSLSAGREKIKEPAE